MYYRKESYGEMLALRYSLQAYLFNNTINRIKNKNKNLNNNNKKIQDVIHVAYKKAIQGERTAAGPHACLPKNCKQVFNIKLSGNMSGT